MALIYPGIWGVLQPVTPRTEKITSLLFPYVLHERLAFTQPSINQQDSYLRLSQYSYVAADTMTFSKMGLTAATSLNVTVVYQTYAMADAMSFSKISLDAATTLTTTIAYQSITTTDSLALGKPTVGGSLTVVVEYVNTNAADSLPARKPVLTSNSSLV